MLKALIKKELQRLIASFMAPRSNKKKNKMSGNNSGKGSIGMICLWIFVFISLCFAFAGMCHMTGEALLPLGMDWLYYALAAIVGFILNIFLNSFMASSVLFNAKDNDLLLSMPIPPSYILISRMVELLVLGFVYSLVVTLPAFIMRCIIVGFDGGHLLGCILITVFMAFSTTAVSAIVGWVISAIGKKIKNKSLFTVAFTVIFLCAYYYFYFNISGYLTKLVENSLGIGEAIRKSIFGEPVYQSGLAMAGNPKAMLVCLVLTAALFAAVYYVLSRTFIKVATTSEKVAQRTYNAKQQEQVALQTPRKALFKKELSRFVTSPVYMLNCGLGLLFIAAAAVVLFIKGSYLYELLNQLILGMQGTHLAEHLMSDLIPIGGVVIVILLTSMCDIAAPSISLEGKNIWILKSLPLSAADIFYAKENLQFYVTSPVVIVFFIAYAFVFKIDYSLAILMAVAVLVYIRLHAALSVLINLKMPNLNWTNEAVPVKQSLAVLIALFGTWVVAAIIGAIYYFFAQYHLAASEYCVALIVIFVLALRFTNRWLNTKGAELFAAL